MSEILKKYRACYFINGEKHYIKNGKFYNDIGACKRGIRNDAYSMSPYTELTYTIEEYEVKWVCDPQYAVVKCGSAWYDMTVEYKEVD